MTSPDDPSKDVIMLLSNPFRPDPRVLKEANSLAANGHRVTVLCWDRKAELPEQEVLESGVRIERIHHVRTVYGAGASQIRNTPRFWSAAIHRAGKGTYKVIHCHDLDTLPAGWWLKRSTGAKLIFDAHEDYPALMSQYLPKLMVTGLGWLERKLLKRVDYTITASSVYAQKLRNQGFSKTVAIGNYQDLTPYLRIKPEQIKKARLSLDLNEEDYIVSYIGGFTRNRLILPLIEAASSLPDVIVLLWGDGHQRDEVARAANQTRNVRYLGWLPSDQVPLHFCLSDVIYYCLLPDYPGATYNAPNTLSSAMAAGCPIIANDVGDLGSIVRQTSCGLLLPEVTPEHIRQAIISLENKSLRDQLGGAGKRAAQTEYNWEFAQSRLLEVYHILHQ